VLFSGDYHATLRRYSLADTPLFVFYRPNGKVRPALGIAVGVILLAAMIS
jgi:hypothetical protein